MEIIIKCSDDNRGSKNVFGEPTQEVVRCKDCRFHEQEQPGMVYCPATVGGWVEENWFCKGGERRSE